MKRSNMVDSLEKALELSAFWNWLPAFRVVAETEHLPTASKALGISASALSRTIRLLEERLEVELFARKGRRIELTRAGEKFLSSVRYAMRGVHEGLLDLGEARFRGSVRIASSGFATSAYVLPASLQLQNSYPELTVSIETVSKNELTARLLSGDLDVAFVEWEVGHEDLKLELLAKETHGIYCGPGHPLYRKRKVSLEMVQKYGFAAPPPLPSGASPEGWPAQIDRKVSLYATQMAVGVSACAAGRLLAVLPDSIASRATPKLHKIPLELISPTSLYSLSRKRIHYGRAELMIEQVRMCIVGS